MATKMTMYEIICEIDKVQNISIDILYAELKSIEFNKLKKWAQEKVFITITFYLRKI